MPSVITIPTGQANVPGQIISGEYNAIAYVSSITQLVNLLNDYKIPVNNILSIKYDTSELQYFVIYKK